MWILGKGDYDWAPYRGERGEVKSAEERGRDIKLRRAELPCGASGPSSQPLPASAGGDGEN